MKTLNTFTERLVQKLSRVPRRVSNLIGIAPRGVITLRTIAKFLPRNPVIVEAGAFNGVDTVKMALFWPRGTVHAFEPTPTAYASLADRTAQLRNVYCYQLALSDSVGMREMYLSSGRSTASSSLQRPKSHLEDHPDVYFRETIQAATTTLPQWQQDFHVEHIDFLWLDMQGHELTMLKAATDTLTTVSAIFTEVSLKETYEGVPLYHEVRDWMAGQGFSVQAEALAWSDMGTVLFVRTAK